MAVTMQDVRSVLDPEEPDYERAAELGPDALPHLEALVNSGDAMLASKATYAASLIKHDRTEEIVRAAAQSSDAAVRVAAASAARNMSASGSSNVLLDLVADPDPGVRKVARAAVPDKPSDQLNQRLEELGDEPGAADATTLPEGPAQTGQPMPGEGGTGAMPSEESGRMPGEGGRMPGE
jgi:hypothetical protein